MAEKDDKKQILVKLTPREAEVLKEIDYLEKQNILPSNKTEIFKRGLHVVKYLAEVNERSLLDILLEKLSHVTKNPSASGLDTTLALSTVILAVMISKRGVLASEAFETIPLTLKQFQYADLNKVDQKYSMEILKGLATSVDTIFLKHPLNSAKSTF